MPKTNPFSSVAVCIIPRFSNCKFISLKSNLMYLLSVSYFLYLHETLWLCTVFSSCKPQNFIADKFSYTISSK